MEKQLAFRFWLEPAPEQAALMRQPAGCRRFVRSKAPALQSARLEAKLPAPGLQSQPQRRQECGT